MSRKTTYSLQEREDQLLIVGVERLDDARWRLSQRTELEADAAPAPDLARGLGAEPLDVNWILGNQEVQLNAATLPDLGDVQATTGPEPARVTLDSYRVRARWVSDYGRTADLLSRLRSITRAVSVHSLALRPDEDGIRVDLELEVYIDGAT